MLSSAQRGILAVHGENGYPYRLPINFLYLDGKIYFHCAKAGHCLIRGGILTKRQGGRNFILTFRKDEASRVT
ncbi:MAG: hypothetical protein IJQ96_08695 [Bacteroidales bacterium]|nr:hypothetical protein [Bacteroidales bacterium]